MPVIIYICGVYSLAFALFHLGFWKIFNWKEDLKKLSFANRGIMQILNVQLTYYLFFVAYVCFAFSNELPGTRLGTAFLAGNAVFWLVRTIQQFIFLRQKHYIIHLLTILFAAGALLFALPLLIKSI